MYKEYYWILPKSVDRWHLLEDVVSEGRRFRSWCRWTYELERSIIRPVRLGAVLHDAPRPSCEDCLKAYTLWWHGSGASDLTAQELST